MGQTYGLMTPRRQPIQWLEIRVTIAAEAAEAVGEELSRLGARGHASLEPPAGTEPVRTLVAYFPIVGADRGQTAAGDIVSSLERFLSSLPGWGLDPGPAEVVARTASDEEWRDQWRSFFHPIRVGRRFIIYPPWERPAEVRPGDVTISIDPGQAFGTGSHATTRGALELLEEVLSPGDGEGTRAESSLPAVGIGPVLDLGTGSGVLAITAARLGATKLLAVDNDPLAVDAAAENSRANGVAGQVEVVLGDALGLLRQAASHYHLILANLTTDLVAHILPDVARALAPGGLFVAAGISSGEGEERVAAAARKAGLLEVERRSAEGWTSFLLRRGPAGTAGRPPARAVFHTLGCKTNLYDTAGVMNDLRAAGWEVCFEGGEPSGRVSDADLYVVNSCAVTARAESKSRQLARKLKREHPGALVALIGCYPAVHREEAAATAGVDLVLGTQDRGRLAEMLREKGRGAREEAVPAASAEAVVPGAFAGERTRATLKVQDGCEQFCTYCVVPYARGPSRSRPAAEVLEEAARLVRAGFGELVVTGIHLGAWGLDLVGSSAAPGAPAAGGSGVPRLADLVRDIAGTPGLARVRLSSIEPMEISEDLLNLLTSDRKVCRHLHVPLQSGSDTVLARMNRRYTAADFLAMVRRVREAVPLIGLTTDIMVGFPGETDDEFGATLDTVRRARFSRLHVFRYSRRPGTPAADMPGQVDESVKRARSDELISLGRRLGRRFRESLVGETLNVLVERISIGASGAYMAEGLADNYVRVEVPLEIEEGPVNTIVAVTVQGLTREGLAGRYVLGSSRTRFC